MEVVYLLTCAAGASAFGWCATGDGARHHASGWGQRLAHRWLWAACLALSRTLPVTLLLRSGSWQAAADEVIVRARGRGVALGRDDACALLVMASLALSTGLAVAARSSLGFVVGIVGTLVAVPLRASSQRRARARALVDEMPEVFRTLALALGSGETLMQAIEYVGVHERGHAGAAFGRAALRLRCGASTEDALAALSSELEAPGVGLLTTALVIAQRTGSPLRGLLQSSAELVERQGEYERMLAVKTAQVRLSVRIVCLLPLLLVGMLSLISVDFQHGLATPAGMVSLLLASAMDGLALFIIHRLMRGVL